MLFDEIGAAFSAQHRSLPYIFAEVDRARAELLPEIDRVKLQLLDFDEHQNLRRPRPIPRRPAEARTETKVSQGAMIKNKGRKSGCQGRFAGWIARTFAFAASHLDIQRGTTTTNWN